MKGLRSGVDLVKPFASSDLLTRVEAPAQRGGRSSMLSFGQAEMDLASHRVSVFGAPVELTPKEFDLLEALIRGTGRVLTCMEIKQDVWGFSFDAPTKVVDLYVHYLRRKLAEAGAGDLIQTIRGIGCSIGR